MAAFAAAGSTAQPVALQQRTMSIRMRVFTTRTVNSTGRANRPAPTTSLLTNVMAADHLLTALRAQQPA